jgi:hypothetical protein
MAGKQVNKKRLLLPDFRPWVLLFVLRPEEPGLRHQQTEIAIARQQYHPVAFATVSAATSGRNTPNVQGLVAKKRAFFRLILPSRTCVPFSLCFDYFWPLG